MNRSTRVGVVWLCGAFVYLTLEGVAAAAYRPRYSYLHDFISDLGVPGINSPCAWLMNVGFCVQSSLFLIGAVTSRLSRLFAALVGVNTLGNVVIAFFHSGSATHAVGAVAAIVGGNAALVAGSSIIGGWHRRVSIGLGAVGVLSFALFVVALNTPGLPTGALERGSVYPITAWQLLTGALVLRHTMRKSDVRTHRWSRLD